MTSGPSLWRDWSDELFDSYELVFAVNRAGLFNCHYWGLVDEHMRGIVANGARLPEMAFFSNRVVESRKSTFTLGLYGAEASRLYEKRIKPMQTGPCFWTMPCLLQVAGHVADSLKAPLDIYGLDCSLELATRWKMELPWVRFAMPENIGEIRGEIDEKWKAWILGEDAAHEGNEEMHEVLEPQMDTDIHR